jgi:hypothetical protein
MASSLFSELFVNNLEGTATEEALKALFSPYGIVESCWVTEKKGNAFGVVRCAARRSPRAPPSIHATAASLTIRAAAGPAPAPGSRPMQRPSRPRRRSTTTSSRAGA